MMLLKKAIATNIILLLLAGSMTAGLVTYKVYQTYETTKYVSTSVECINKRLDFCSIWSAVKYDIARKPTFWDAKCGVEPTESLCKSIIKGGGSDTSTTTSTSTTSTTSTSTTSTTSTSTSTTSTSTTSTTSTSTTSTSTTTSTTTSICSGTTSLDCSIPSPGIGNERIWGGDVFCGRTNAEINCMSTGETICIPSGVGLVRCLQIEPSMTGYSVSSKLIGIGASFSIGVTGTCPVANPDMPGKCLMECGVIHPDGHYIYIDAWDEDGTVTLSSVTCNSMGDYIVDYCGIYTDFTENDGWGTGFNNREIVSCVGDCDAWGGICRSDEGACSGYCGFMFRLPGTCIASGQCSPGCCCRCI